MMLTLEDQATLDLVGQKHNVAVLGFPIYESMINFSRAVIDQSGEILFNFSRQRNDTIPTSGKEKRLEGLLRPDCAGGIRADAQETNNNYRTTDHGDGNG